MPTTRRYPDLLAFEQTLSGMLADPEVTGDLLLVGLCMARRIHFGDWRDGESASSADMSLAVFGPDPATVIVPTNDAGDRIGGPVERVVCPRDIASRWRSAMRADIRRYDYRYDPANGADPVHAGYGRPCAAPMVRRSGTCGHRASIRGLLTDPETGRRINTGACNRHAAWWREHVDANRAALQALGDQRPIPPANTGGALRRHLPGFRWADYWRKLDERWVEPPEAEPFVPPALTLVLCDDFEPVDMPRPTLTLIEGDSDA